MSKNTKALAVLGLATSLAMILSYVEFLLPPLFSAVPGIKIGLPNIIIIFALYRMGIKEAAAISFVRLCLSSLLFGTALTFVYSLAGAVLSLAAMAILKKIGAFSIVGISVAGGVLHNLGQTLVAVLILGTAEIAYYMVILTLTGTVAGVFVGLAGATLLKYIKKI